MVAAGGLLEWARVFGRGYGTPRAPVEQALAAGRDVVFDIDWQGYRLLRAALPGDVVGVFVLPPSLADLERRLRARAGDDAAEIGRRMAAAREEIAPLAGVRPCGGERQLRRGGRGRCARCCTPRASPPRGRRADCGSSSPVSTSDFFPLPRRATPPPPPVRRAAPAFDRRRRFGG